VIRAPARNEITPDRIKFLLKSITFLYLWKKFCFLMAIYLSIKISIST